MQIHKEQCAKNRLFQEGYSVTPQMHSYNISCQGFSNESFFPQAAGHLLWQSLNESWLSVVDDYRKKYV